LWGSRATSSTASWNAWQAARQALWVPDSSAPEKLVSDGGSNQTCSSTSAALSAASIAIVASIGGAIR
jgi:hypothetical protein